MYREGFEAAKLGAEFDQREMLERFHELYPDKEFLSQDPYRRMFEMAYVHPHGGPYHITIRGESTYAEHPFVRVAAQDLQSLKILLTGTNLEDWRIYEIPYEQLNRQ